MKTIYLPCKIAEIRFCVPKELEKELEERIVEEERVGKFNGCHAHIFLGLLHSRKEEELEEIYKSSNFTPEPYNIDFVRVCELIVTYPDRLIMPANFVRDKYLFQKEVTPRLVKRIGKVEWN